MVSIDIYSSLLCGLSAFAVVCLRRHVKLQITRPYLHSARARSSSRSKSSVTCTMVLDDPQNFLPRWLESQPNGGVDNLLKHQSFPLTLVTE